MKIAIFSWEYTPFLVGGLGVYTSNIAKKFVENGNEVSIFSLNINLQDFEEKNGIKVYRPFFQDTSKIFSLFVNEDLRKWGSNLKFFTDMFNYNLLSANRLIGLIKKGEQFDIIAVHDWLSAFSGLILKDTKIPIIFHQHSAEEQRNPGSSSEVLKNLERKMRDEAEKIVTVSNSMRDFLISIGCKAEKTLVCYNGCDPNVYDPKKVDLNLVEKLRERYKLLDNTIFFIGRLVWFKGIFNLVQAMPIVLEEFPKTKLIMVGIGWDYEKLIDLIEKLGLRDKIILRNEWLSEEEKVAHYTLADLCVFPSLTEPFGIVASEAMAMKKPVVVGAAGISGLKEQVIPSGEKRTGVHIDGNSKEDIAWGIKEVLKNLEEAKKWGKNGRKRVLENFTWDIVAKKTLSIYKELIK
jgi:glycosyltransferase involved in cell wall biosynthesis